MKTIIQTSIFIFAWLLGPPKVFAQACPACSNPALQSSEKLEAGFDTISKGAFRTTLNITNGFNYQGGHPNWKGLSTESLITEVPLHNHIVSLDFIRSEIAFEYAIKTNWTAWLRIPYDIKIQTAIVEFVNPVTEFEKEAILRNRDIHLCGCSITKTNVKCVW